MTDDQINKAIAEACGWTDFIHHPEFGLMGVPPDTHGCRVAVQEYTEDLNAMHEAEKVLTLQQYSSYFTLLDTEGVCFVISATARQRAEAFLRVLGKWEEAQE